ncbi:hypothetical protein [Falsirhodobacter deserti]|uniref:hypothetical protein n=1 Tax=Falsirhodobacter deserti TaxID=1365611 RepID=UPI000FE2F3CE|nr:hypothetical protein [Falsirhodobacter deserti]
MAIWTIALLVYLSLSVIAFAVTMCMLILSARSDQGAAASEPEAAAQPLSEPDGQKYQLATA